MRTLVFWGEAPLSEARARAAEGGTLVLLWGRREAEPDPALKTPDWREEMAARIEDAVTAWADAFADRPSLDGRPFRDLWAWQETTLWPLARRFLRSSESASSHCVRLIESFSLVFETELPDEVEAVGLPKGEVRLLERCCTARGVLFQGKAKSRPARGRGPAQKSGLLGRMRALRSAFGGARPKAVSAPVVFVRPEGEANGAAEAVERLLRVAREDMGLDLAVVGGEDGILAAERLDEAARKALSEAGATLTGQLTTLKDAPSTLAAFAWEGASFADDAAEADLTALLQGILPGALRRAEGLRALLRASRFKILCAHAADRLALAAARAEGVPTLALEGAADGPRVLQALKAAARGEGMVG